MGSRYGGLKQVDPVGPSGETLLDYAVFDAIRAGFGRIVFLIRTDIEAVFREKIGARYQGRLAVDYAFQSAGDLPGGCPPAPGREKPWGTGHAVWCARSAIRGNFAAINADDFYGADAYVRLAGFLKEAEGMDFAMVGYPLAQTLSEHGSVSRGICATDGGWLKTVVEHTGIQKSEVGPGLQYAGTETVSMNCWGFTPGVFPLLETALRTFLAARSGDPKAECYLPESVGRFIAQGLARVCVLPTSAEWFGVTYRDDKPRVAAALAERVRRGEYPKNLF
jgi:NDP-sugar pyrophosphorylase family protein